MNALIIDYNTTFLFEETPSFSNSGALSTMAPSPNLTMEGLVNSVVEAEERKIKFEMNQAKTLFTDQYIAFLKQVSLNLTSETKQYFFDPNNQELSVFPLF